MQYSHFFVIPASVIMMFLVMYNAIDFIIYAHVENNLNQKGMHPQRYTPFNLHAHAGSHPEGGCDGGEYGNYDVQDFTPKFFFHF